MQVSENAATWQGKPPREGTLAFLFTLETPWESQPSNSSAPAAQTQSALSSVFGHRTHPGLPNLPPAQARCSSVLHVFQKHEFSVDMTCEGCSNAVTRVLNKLGGELLAQPCMPRTRPQQLRMHSCCTAVLGTWFLGGFGARGTQR